MLQRSNNQFDIEELNNLHCIRVSHMIYKIYTDTNLLWNLIPSNREQTKAFILKRVQKCLNSNLSHVAIQNNRVVACVLSIDLKNLENLLEGEKQQPNLSSIFDYVNKQSEQFYSQMIQYNKQEHSKKSAVMLFSAVEPEFANTHLFFNLIQWNIDQLLLSGYQKYFGILGNSSRFLTLSSDKVEILSTYEIQDKEYNELDKYKMNLVCYNIKPLQPRPSL